MKKGLSVIVSLIICLYISACSKSNVDDDVSFRNRNLNKTEATRVNYNTPNHGGPAITSVDTSDPEIDRERNRNNRYPGNNRNRNDSSKIIVSNQTANKVTDLSEIDRAHILVTDNNAYVAVKLEGTPREHLTSRIRNKITKAVKSVDSDIDNVYISENLKFFKRMDGYTHDIRQGRVSSRFIHEFSDTIRRVFPDAR
ncbi:YhcN/YlaJ family sporulation lipoprotein [Neobacillus cucumis]|uniref:YhcN/YlaJ family sporulation lipoprotein n=2 Tax=Neobacillus cucumis TaxID=1740721 RepID=A0A2N5H7Q2_9BACI|nr:YhcN/YlaJ family sporulation lipoprotein [Neobacillus cucumis]